MKKEKLGFYISMIAGAAMAIAATAMCLWFFVFRTALISDEKTVELGDQLSENINAYMFGAPFMHKETTIDVSEVNMGAEGDYKVSICKKGEMFYVTVHVVDTTEPVIDVADDLVFTELGANFLPSHFAKLIEDASGLVTTNIYYENKLVATESTYEKNKQTCVFNENGEYDIIIEAVDAAGNSATAEIRLDVHDTLPPVITELKRVPYFAIKRDYVVSDFVDKIEDLSGFYNADFIINGKPQAKISFAEIGMEDIVIRAVDESGNESEVTVTAPVDEAPIFVAARDYQLSVNSNYDINKNIIAVDNTDGNITAKIVVTGDDFDRGSKGTYSVTYTATDSNGLATEIVQNITVADSEDTSFSLEDDELDLLFDYNYFGYNLLSSPDTDAAIKMVEPTLVNLIYRFGNGGYTAGSGFIYSIDRDNIYIVTCRHVLVDMKGNIEIMFCDERSSVVNIDPPYYETIGNDNEGAMFKINTSLVSAEVLLQLREIYSDPLVYGRLQKGDEIISYSGHWLNKEPTIRKMTYHKKNANFLADAKYCVESSHNVKGGMSGTATFDRFGCLIGIVEGYRGVYNTDKGAYDYVSYHLMVDKLDDLYERIKKS